MSDRYDPIIQTATDKYLPGVDWRLYKAQLWQESRLNPRAVSPAGAGGIAQFIPTTWDEQAPRAGYGGASRFDAVASIMTGAFYMRWLLSEWSWPRPEIDRHCLALASYNSGLGDLLKAQRESGNESLYAPIAAKLHIADPGGCGETIEYV
jgi:membrane-bound lytic murein transglycosylase F